ncbi:hypothetical protein WHJ47_14245, partial [Staphylococcus aureus]|uniref:hypothetical protein n=1 Tax=Staphylococcus aureus TaxID=1280 RepID=UPI0039BECFBB
MRELLESLGLITDTELISEGTRDSVSVHVWRDRVSGVIWNEGYPEAQPTGLEYWGAKTLAEARYKTLADDMRRAAQFNKYLKGKTVLDFGCGHGGFIKQIEGVAE